MIRAINLDRVVNLKKLTEVASLVPRGTLWGIVFDPEEYPERYLPMIHVLKGLGHRVMGRAMDSAAEKQIGLAERRKRIRRYAKELQKDIDILEIGNELGGTWLGASAGVQKKVNEAQEICNEYGVLTAVTWYYMTPQYRLLYWMENFKLNQDPDYALLSIYPGWHKPPQNWDYLFESFSQKTPMSKFIGIGEYGIQPKTTGKAELIKTMETLYVDHPKFERFGFYWDGAVDVVQSKELLPVFLNVWNE